MRHSSVLLQIFSLLFGLGLGFTYVYPSLGQVSDDQDRIAEYQNAIEEAEYVNTLIGELQQEIDDVDPAAQERLETYLPSEIDPVGVQRDIIAYVERRNLALRELSVVVRDERRSEQPDETRNIQTFQVLVSGSYEEIKNLLADTEANVYPLHVRSLTIGEYEGGLLNASIQFSTYAFANENNDSI